MVVWLLIHFAVLAGTFGIFVNWQLQLGLDSVLSGAAGDRLKTLGSAVASDLRAASRGHWQAIMDEHLSPYGLDSMLILSRGGQVVGEDLEVPADIDKRLKDAAGGRGPVPRRSPGPNREEENREDEGGFPPPPGPMGELDDGPRFDGPMSAPPRGGPTNSGPPRRDEGDQKGPEVRPVFLTRSNVGGYWAAVDLPLFDPTRENPLHGMLVLRSENASAGGLFFDLKPWLLGGLAVLFLSLLLWAPFIIGITRYVSRLSRATERIAQGKFDTQVQGVRHDELGSLGKSIEEMAQQIDRLLRGQKRFLGGVAHDQ